MGSRALGRKPGADRILQGLTTAVVVVDAGLQVTDLNTAAENLLGVSRRQAAYRPVGEFFTPPDEPVALCRRALDTGLTCGVREVAARVGERETVLDCRAAPLEGKHVILMSGPYRRWSVARLSGVRGEPAERIEGLTFDNPDDAERAVFRLRWEAHTGQPLAPE